MDTINENIPSELQSVSFPLDYRLDAYIDGQALVKLINEPLLKEWKLELQNEVPEAYHGAWKAELEHKSQNKTRKLNTGQHQQQHVLVTDYSNVLKRIFLHGWNKINDSVEWTRVIHYHYGKKKSNSGRLHSYLAGQQLPRRIRNTLYQNCQTLDIENCFFNLAFQF